MVLRRVVYAVLWLSLGGCDAVFRLDPVDPVTDADDVIRNVDEFVLARYELDETAGVVAADSGPPPALDLTIDQPGSVVWEDGALDISQEVRLSSGFDATKIITACTQSNEISIEAWVTPANATQDGPARLVSISRSANIRNVTLSQSGDSWNLRVRNHITNENGLPELEAPSSVSLGLTHVVATQSLANRSLYVNGVLRARDTLGGSLESWVGHPLVVANELDGQRVWLGALHRIVIFSRELSFPEVTARFAAGL